MTRLAAIAGIVVLTAALALTRPTAGNRVGLPPSMEGAFEYVDDTLSFVVMNAERQ